MKARRKLIPAIVLLLVSVLMLSTASYAWFANNNTVTATGMSVTAKSDANFLIIGTTKTGEKVSVGADPAAATVSGAVTLLPVAPAIVFSEAANKTKVETNSSWHYAYSNSLTSATINGDYTVVPNSATLIGTSNYVGKATFYIGLDETSSLSSTTDVVAITDWTITNNASNTSPCPLKAVITLGDTYVGAITGAHTDGEKIDLNQSTASKTSSIEVNVYYYIDGDMAAVYTNNIANLANMSLGLSFSLVAPTLVA